MSCLKASFSATCKAHLPARCGIGSADDEFRLSAVAVRPTSVEVALARIRQLSAHEVGHTLGFAHNFAASTYADRASVMDYPAPRAKIVDGFVMTPVSRFPPSRPVRKRRKAARTGCPVSA